MLIDLALDPETGDLVLDGDLELVGDDVAGVRQWLAIALDTQRGEYALDLDAGLPYLDEILVKAPKLQIIRQIFRAAILACPYVEEVLDLTLTLIEGTLALGFTAVVRFPEEEAAVVDASATFEQGELMQLIFPDGGF